MVKGKLSKEDEIFLQVRFRIEDFHEKLILGILIQCLQEG